MKLVRMLGMSLIVLVAVGAASAQSQWTPVQHVPNIGAGAVALLTDGRVLVHDESGNPGTWQNWWTLTSDANGHYETGTWAQVASTASTYGPLYFASAVLPDGRYIIEGGEYNNGNDAWTKLGAIYDPVANSWTNVNPPSGWSSIGDASASVLTNGTWLLGSCCDTAIHTALLNASNLTWTATGAGKFDVYDEEGLTLLPNSKLLDVDAYVFHFQSNGMNYELYDPSSGTWTSQGNTPVQLWDSSGSYEEGPDVLMPNGTVYATGANGRGAGHTAVYTWSNNTWVAGPDFPNGLDIADGPGALETNGKVLLMTSPGIFNPGSVFFEWDGSHLNQITGPPNGPGDVSYYGHLLMLPTGQVLFTDFSNDVELFNSTGSTYSGWTPSVLLSAATLQHGTTVLLNGFKFNGASQDGAYGDDFQDATNYPLVRFTSTTSGQVYYARTHDHSTMAVGYSGPTFTHVDIPNIPTGSYNLQVVVNGIPSQNYPIGIR
ncbi:MAG: hypothetical protein WA655_16690 [Candidatus Korobacteraceae bacterium]